MSEKKQHLSSQQLEAWIQEAHDHVLTELPEGYDGVSAVKKEVAVLRENLRQAMHPILIVPISFQSEQSALCKRLDEVIADFSSVIGEADVPAELKDLVIALVKSSRRKVRKILAEEYDFQGNKSDLYAIAGGSITKRTTVSKFLSTRVDALLTSQCLELSRELRIQEYIRLSDSFMIDLAYPAGVHRRMAKRLKRYADAVNKVVACIDAIDSVLQDYSDKLAPLSFEQLREIVLNTIDGTKAEVKSSSSLGLKSGSFTLQLLSKTEAVFKTVTEDGFMTFSLQGKYGTHAATAERSYRELAAASDQKASSLPSARVEEFTEDVPAPVQAEVPSLDDLEIHNESGQPAIPELDGRISQVLTWFEALPTPQRFSYVRHEMKALHHILEDRNCYDHPLVMFALQRLEDVMESAEVILNGRAVTTKPDEDKLAAMYSRIFTQLDRCEVEGDACFVVEGAFQKIDGELGALGGKIMALEETMQNQRETFRLHMEGLEPQLADVIAAHDQCERELAELKTVLQKALTDDDFEKMQSLSLRPNELKKKIAELKTQWGDLERQVESLRQKRQLQLENTEGSRRSLETEKRLQEARLHSLKTSLTALVERSRSEDTSVDSQEDFS